MKTLMMLALVSFAPYYGSAEYTFTSDSVYKKDNILTVEIQKEADSSVSLYLKQNYILGYEIYDNPETPYIDGLKVDDNFVTDWKVPNFTYDLDHIITIKTVYSSGVDGMIASAKDGDISKILANPLVLLQLGYYSLAAVSLIIGGFGLFKSRKLKLKSSEEIADAVTKQAELSKQKITDATIGILNNLVTPVFEKLKAQNQSIIEALVLAKSGKSEDIIAMIDLLKKSASEDISIITEQIKKSIEEANDLADKTKQEAIKVIKEISTENVKTEPTTVPDDGTTI